MFQNQQIHPTIKAKSRLKAVLATSIDLITPNANLCSCFVSLKVYFISPPNLHIFAKNNDTNKNLAQIIVCHKF